MNATQRLADDSHENNLQSTCRESLESTSERSIVTMAASPPPYPGSSAEEKDTSKKLAPEQGPLADLDDRVSLTSGQDVLALEDLDPALNMKMHLVNNVSDC